MDSDGKGYTIAISHSDFEKVNPIQHFREAEIFRSTTLYRDIFLNKYPNFPKEILEKLIQKEAEKDWVERYNQIKSVHVPEALISLLSASKKSEQVKLLKGIQLESFMLVAFICKAYSDYGFHYSKLRGEHLPAGVNQKDLPKLIRKDKNGTIIKVGETELTDGQLKNVLEHRSITIAHILENGTSWHCLFITYNSIGGKENYKNGQPHFHYISDKFKISREELIKQIKSKDYKLGNLPHIDLLDYGIQPTPK